MKKAYCKMNTYWSFFLGDWFLEPRYFLFCTFPMINEKPNITWYPVFVGLPLIYQKVPDGQYLITFVRNEEITLFYRKLTSEGKFSLTYTFGWWRNTLRKYRRLTLWSTGSKLPLRIIKLFYDAPRFKSDQSVVTMYI